jgi:hypothetical protein
MGLLFVNSVAKFCANDREQAHALGRRIRISTLCIQNAESNDDIPLCGTHSARLVEDFSQRR